MPIHDYRCRDCTNQFEVLVRSSASPSCPRCQGRDLERLLSAFAVKSQQTQAQALKDGRRRSALMKNEKDRAEREYEKNHDH